jgi:hypothetical protein
MLNPDPVFERAEIIADVKISGGLHSGKDSCFHDKNPYRKQFRSSGEGNFDAEHDGRLADTASQQLGGRTGCGETRGGTSMVWNAARRTGSGYGSSSECRQPAGEGS